MTQRQEAPFAVQIELVEGCNLRCSFCGLNGIREPKNHNFKFMGVDTLISALIQMVDAGWNPRIEFAMHGEPSMHPDLVLMIRRAREFAPKFWLMMTSNGGGLLRKPGPAANVRALFDVGLNVLALDDYDGAGIIPKIRAAIETVRAEWPSSLHTREYPADPLGNPHRRGNVRSTQMISFVADISHVAKGDGTHSLLNNHAGAGAPLNDSQAGKRCAKPFREMSIRWDGSVAVCCNDWRGTYKCGNVVTDGLDEVWNGPAMHAARQKLILGERDFGPCRGCDAVSYRVGLLPDKMGEQSLSAPDAGTYEAIGAALAGSPLTTPVLRPWEQP